MYVIVSGVLLVLLLLVPIYRWRRQKAPMSMPCAPVQLVHKLGAHHNVVQNCELQQKDSLDEHLDVLTRKLAEKEGRLHLNKSKIREKQFEIENLHAIDDDVRQKYRDIMETLRSDLLNNEKECRKLQEQIEWISLRRAELNDELRQGRKMYGQAAAELASNLTELQRGRHTIVEKSQTQYSSTPRIKEPKPSTSPFNSIIFKSPTFSEESLRLCKRN